MMVDDIVYYAAFVLPIILILLYFFTNYNFTGDQAKFYQRLFKIGGAVYAVTFRLGTRNLEQLDPSLKS